MKKVTGKIVLLLLVMQIAHKEAYANNNDPVVTKPLISTVKLIKPVPIRFNSFGKQLEYKRKLAFEGKDSAEAYIKQNQKMGAVDYLELTGGVLTGSLTINSANLIVYGSSFNINTTTDTYLQTLAANNYVSIQAYGVASSGTKSIALNPDGGNVGIGTNSPSTKLQLIGDEDHNRFSQYSGYVYTELAQRDWGGSWGLLLNGYKSNEAVSGQMFTNGIVKYKQSSGVYAMGAAAIGGFLNNASNGGTIDFYSAFGGTAGENINYTQTGSFSLGGTWLSPRGTASDFNVSNNGNVGIGTTTPQTKLEIEVTSVNDNNYISLINNNGWTSNKTNNIIWKDASSVTGGLGMVYNSTTSTVDFTVNSLYNHGVSGTSDIPFIVKGNGNVGIGTTSPSEPLSVVGAGLFGSPGWGLLKIGRDDGTFLHIENPSSDRIISLDAAASKFIQTGYNTDFQFGNNTGVFKANGNVLIGKTSQINTVYKLDVDGIVRANKVVVNTTGADFVFDSTYHLPSLETVADFIKANKHLPQIASAEEMQKNGLDVGEQQTKLLQKIEELTLYAIEQDKKIKQQEQANKQQLDRLRIVEEKLNKLLGEKK